MIKKLLFIGLTIFGLLPNAVNATPWRQAGARLFHSGCTLAGAGLALGVPLHRVYTYSQKVDRAENVLKNGEATSLNRPQRKEIRNHANLDAYPKVRANIRAIESRLKDYGVNDPVLFLAEKKNGKNFAGSLGRGIFALGNDFYFNYNPRAHNGILAHEAGHDVLRTGGTAKTTVWSATALGTFVACKKIKFICPVKAKSVFMRSLLKLPAGMAMAGISIAMQQVATSYFSEDRADRFAALKCTSGELYELSRDFRKYHEHELSHTPTLVEKYKKGLACALEHKDWVRGARNMAALQLANGVTWTHKTESPLGSIFLRIITFHAPHLQRAEYFEREAAKKEALEKLAK